MTTTGDSELIWASLARRAVMPKRHCRPSAQYRYEHYDPDPAASLGGW
jgi:hypothetical protein